MNPTPERWTRAQIEALEPGEPVRYLHFDAIVERIVSRGDNVHGEPYKVVEARYCPDATVTTGVAAGEAIGHLRPAQ